METIGRLAGGIAHDVNNLLTAILLNSDLLAERITDAGLRALAETTRLSAERAGDLTRGLLAYACSQPSGPPRAVNVNSVIEQACWLLNRTLGELIAVTVVAGEDVGMAEVDTSELESAILNLAINARDAMPRGGHLTIETRRDDNKADRAKAGQTTQETGCIVISIVDDGPGMPADVVAHAVDPFFTTKGRSGTGLGLAIVDDFVRHAGGHIRIESTVGVGTTVKLYLPAAVDVATEPEAMPESPAALGGSESILVVEDDRVLLAHVEAMLTDLGYRVSGASTGAQALDASRTGNPFGLLFTDMVMPGGMTGAQLAARMRRRWPNLAVLFTSGHADRSTVGMRVGEAARSAFLAKPYRRRDLAETIRRLLDEARNVGCAGSKSPRRRPA